MSSYTFNPGVSWPHSRVPFPRETGGKRARPASGEAPPFTQTCKRVWGQQAGAAWKGLSRDQNGRFLYNCSPHTLIKKALKKKKKLFQRSPWWTPSHHQLYPPAFPKSPYSEKSLSLLTCPGEPLVLCLRETLFHNLCSHQMIPTIYHLQRNIFY